MKKAKGQDASASSGTPEEQIKALQERIKKLSSHLDQFAIDYGVSESSMQAKMEAISAEISQCVSQIAELQAQLAKSESA